METDKRGLFEGLSRVADARFWGGLPNESPAIALGVLVAVAVVSGLVLRLIRKRAGELKSNEKQGAVALFFTALRKPLALFLWVYGAYLAAVILAGSPWVPEDVRAFVGRLEPLVHAGGIVSLFWLVFRLIRAVEKRMRQWADGTRNILDDVLVPLVGQALRLVLPVLCIFMLRPLLPIPPGADWVIGKAFGIFLIGAVAFMIIKAGNVIETALLRQYQLDTEDNLDARKVYTQVSVLRKIVTATVIVVAAGCMLMMFDPVRQLGTSILASAGIAGVILGFAAQKTLGNLFAGIQIALTQPIRIDDVVIVEGEWGRIEEITLTYVVVRIWDLRRLVVPINYFIDNPFQNWTRKSADLLGTVFLYVDYSVPVGAIRAEVERQVRANANWDGKACGVQVTNCDARAVEVRCLASAADAGKAFNLRCELREGLIDFVQREYPGCLPRVRTDVTALPQEVDFGKALPV